MKVSRLGKSQLQQVLCNKYAPIRSNLPQHAPICLNLPQFAPICPTICPNLAQFAPSVSTNESWYSEAVLSCRPFWIALGGILIYTIYIPFVHSRVS